MNNNIVFSDNDYNNGNGMMTAVWGPPLWFTLHTISFNYPIKPSEVDKIHYYKYFKYLGKILPCKYCRENYKKNIKETNFGLHIFENRYTFSKWVYDLHNVVNKSLGKNIIISYDEVRNKYENFRARCINDQNNINTKKEKGCTIPLYGVKSKCIMNIVPKSDTRTTLKIEEECLVKKK